MRRRASILAAGLALCLTACGGGDDGDKKPSVESTRLGTPSAPLTEASVECGKYADAAQKITDAQSELYSGTGGSEAIEDLLDELAELAEDAPPDVQAALANLSSAFTTAAEIVKDPTPENQARIAELAPKLAADGQKVTAYVVSKCS